MRQRALREDPFRSEARRLPRRVFHWEEFVGWRTHLGGVFSSFSTGQEFAGWRIEPGGFLADADFRDPGGRVRFARPV